MDIIKGLARRPISAERLIEIVEKKFKDEEGVLYIGYPVLSSSDEAVSIDALLITRNYGVVSIALIEGKDLGDYKELQDEAASLLESKLMQHKTLREGRKLLARPRAITYAPMISTSTSKDEHLIVNNDNIIETIISDRWKNPDLYESVLSVIQTISSIRKNRRRRRNIRENSHGAILQSLEDSIANLDSRQSRAVIETVDGVQRIRGLAGSGKTIVLALKAAYLHTQNPDWKIAVTFNTRSLKDQFIKLIETFVVEQTGELPNDNLKVINAWGAPGGDSRNGVYHQFCVENGVTYIDYGTAKMQYGSAAAFMGAVSRGLKEVKNFKKLFDAILVDEAQDFDPVFLRLCYHSLGKEKRLVYAYDELQSLTDASLPGPEELFGTNDAGVPLVTFDGSNTSQDIILEKCYRNSRPVLASAHALGFGIYRKIDPKLGTGLIQMFDRAELWKDVGYEIRHGELADDKTVTLARSKEASPNFLEAPEQVDPLIVFKAFNNSEEQAIWLAEQIAKNLNENDLRPEDIIVINPDPLSTAKQVGAVRQLLFNKGISSHLAGVDTSADTFFKPDENSVAFTGIFRAKGNEAGMVYVMNAQDCYNSFGGVGRVRNRLFTAMTRSKAWVRVVGHGSNMEHLIDEYNQIKHNDYQLIFQYPNAKLRERLRVVNRDMSTEEKNRVKSAKSTVSTLVQQLSAGEIQIDDLPSDQIEALRNLLSR